MTQYVIILHNLTKIEINIIYTNKNGSFNSATTTLNDG